MHVELLIIGDEILDGTVIDENSAWLGAFLNGKGLRVQRRTTVPDDKGAITAALKQIIGRADLCICTGGLGPTDDDLTLDAVATVTQDELIFDKRVWDQILTRYAGRPVPENNRKQAYVLKRGSTLVSEVGTAPATRTDVSGCTLYVLPGVPMEMKWHCKTYLTQYLDELGIPNWHKRTLRFTGIGESRLAAKITELKLPSSLIISYRTASPENHLRLRSLNVDDLSEAIAKIQSALTHTFIGFDEMSLAHALVARLESRGLTIGTAESCTGGLIGAELTSVPGASAVYMGSIVSYSNSVKSGQLGVTEMDLIEHGAVSEVVAAQMAKGASEALGTDVALSVTGIAGPGGGSIEKPVGTVCFGWYGPDLAETTRVRFRGDREQVRRRAVGFALDRLRREYA
ncbi:MAG: CinA family nicotinamide mononucleotide deamidase-related protein [Myxococcota bacterium]|nr:CinA family nicotinamide mononucleotide deamidase-related protein [Myxococcota bacterium]